MTEKNKLNTELAILLNKSVYFHKRAFINGRYQPIFGPDYVGPQAQFFCQRLKASTIKKMIQLVKNGADINTSSVCEKSTLLMRAAEFGRKDFLAEVLALHPDLHQKDVNGETALHYAARLNREKAVEMLLQAGTFPFVENNYGQKAMAVARAEGSNHSGVMHKLMNAMNLHQVQM